MLNLTIHKIYICVFVAYFADGCGIGLHKNKITCQTYYSQLSSLTSLVCTNIAGNNITILNSCRNCFSLAITANQNTPSLTQLSLCANMYLTNTNYATCASVLGCVVYFLHFWYCQNRASGNLHNKSVKWEVPTCTKRFIYTFLNIFKYTNTIRTLHLHCARCCTHVFGNSRNEIIKKCQLTLNNNKTTNDTINLAGVQMVGCKSGFCGFVRCARRVNSNLLISTCYNQVAATNNATTDALRIRLYINVTSCILARARCNLINPITGQTQNNRFLTTTSSGCFGRTTRSVQLINSLQITSTGDLRVVAFPATTTRDNQLCSTNTINSQSGFANVTCI